MSTELNAPGEGVVPELPLPSSVESTIVQAFRRRLTTDASRTAFRYLAYQPHETVETISFAGVNDRALRTAARLREAGAVGERILLIAEPGIDFITSLFGCLYAGSVAVPAYPPDAFRLGQTIPRLLTMIEDSQAKFMIATNLHQHPLRDQFKERAFDAGDICDFLSSHDNFEPAHRTADDLALLQYTSGSTGTPRGVMLTHGNLLANVEAIRELLDVDDAKMLHWLPPYHDMGLIGGIFSPVVLGRETIFMSPFSFMQRPVRWLQAIHDYRATTTTAPNFGYDVCVRKVKDADCAGLDLSCLKVVISGAERVRVSTLQQFAERFASIGFSSSAFRAAYGLAESTLMVTTSPPRSNLRWLPVPADAYSGNGEMGRTRAAGQAQSGCGASAQIVSCGRPVGATKVLIVDPEQGFALPEGEVGEIWVDSPSNGTGYWRHEEATKHTFHAMLADASDATRYLRTGDLGFIQSGELFVTGRLKELVIVGGRKYFPQDLEFAAAQSHAALNIESAIAFSVEDGDRERLVLVHEVRRFKRYDLDKITVSIRQAILEQFQITPDEIHLLPNGSLPKTSSGKRRRCECRRRFLAGEFKTLAKWTAQETIVEDRVGTPPKTETEQAVAAIWREVLDLTEVYQEDDFFALGGHSLVATQMAVRLEQHFDVKVPIRDVFKSPTVRQLAVQIERKLTGSVETGEPAAEQGHRDLPQPKAALQQIPLLDQRDHTPLSFAEQRMWFSERLQPAHPFYNMPLAARVSATLDQAAVSKSLATIVDRHETLRTTYYLQDGEPRRKIHDPQTLDIAPTFVDLAGASSEQLWQQIYIESRRPFDLIDGPLLRYTVYRVAEDEHIVLLVMHHIVSDGWSMGVMLSEFTEVYRAQLAGDVPVLPPVELQYADFAAWQRANLTDQRLSALLEFWQRQLDAAPAGLDLPLDHPRPAVQDFAGRQVTFALSEELTSRIRHFCNSAQTTPFAFLLSAYFCLLSRLSGQTDICVGTAAASRATTALEGLIGFFVNTLVIRGALDDDPAFDELVQRIGDTALGAQAHGELPFEKLVEHAIGSRDRSRSPIFQAAFVYQRPLGELPAGPGLAIEPLRVDNGTAKHDLTFEFDDVGDRFVATVHYRTTLFERESIERFVASFRTICETAVTEPHRRVTQIPVLDPAQRRQVLDEFNATDFDFGAPHTFHELVESHAHRAGELAIISEDRDWTYGQLSAWSDEIAAGLVAGGVTPGANVATYLPRSPELAAMMLAIFKAGARYVPLNTMQPLARCRSIVKQCVTDPGQPPLVIVPDDERAFAAFAEAMPGEVELASVQELQHAGAARPAALPAVSPDDIAYIIFTSGSTGVPKGVLVRHRSIANFALAHAQRLGVKARDRVLHSLPPWFDGGLSEAVLALGNGATSVIAGEDCQNPQTLVNFIRKHRVTVAKFTPARLASMDDDNLPDLRVMSTGGDTLTGELAAAWVADHRRFFNGYGPTESTVGVSMFEVMLPVAARPPVGTPMANMRAYVLDANRQPLPIGVVGEIFIGGIGVAAGYLGDPTLTRERFVPDPFGGDPQARIYATGDFGRWTAGGELEFVGRMDRQVKVRGYRVEPDEVAAQLKQLPGVRDSAVTVGPKSQLVAYVLTDELQSRDLSNGHVETWQALFGETRRAAPVALDPEFDIGGWMDSYTGRPIDQAAMREWLDSAVANVLSVAPRRVLEIGCGTGMILFRVAPHVEHYTGTDLLESSLAQVESVIQRRADLRDRVRLRKLAADDFSTLGQERFDTIVLNSVVQYFPNVEYLLRVLDHAVAHLAPRGRIVLGDVRSKQHHEALAAGIELAFAEPNDRCEEIARRVAARTALEEELLVDPALFYALQQRYDNLDDVIVQLKSGADHNELTRYRYEVILRFDTGVLPGRAPSDDLPSVRAGSQTELERHLQLLDQPKRFVGLPNARCAEEFGAWEFVRDNPRSIVSDVSCRNGPCTNGLPAPVDPHAIEALAAALHVETRIAWDKDDPRQLQVVAWPANADAGNRVVGTSNSPGQTPGGNSWSRWCNNPLTARQSASVGHALRTALRERLPDYMIPASFVVVESIPQTSSGKVDFAALPAPPETVFRMDAAIVAPRTPTEEKLIEVWESLLGVYPIGVVDDFFELGGHSMLAVRLMAEVEAQLGREIPLSALFHEATIGHLGSLIDAPQSGDDASTLVRLQIGGELAPLFCIHPAGGTVFCYRALAAEFAGSRPVYGLQAVGIDGRSPAHTDVVEMAAHYAAAIVAAYPPGPYYLTGWSLGGALAFEVARQLKAGGHEIGMLALLDATALSDDVELQEDDFEQMIAAMFPAADRVPLKALREMKLDQQLTYFVSLAAQAGLAPANDVEAARHVYEVFRANVKALHQFRPIPYDGPMILVRPRDQAQPHELANDPTLGWQALASAVKVEWVAGDHAQMVHQPYVGELAAMLDRAIRSEN